MAMAWNARELTRRGRRWTAAEAERVLAAWRESEQSMSAFARQRGFDPQRLGWWKKRLAEWNAEGRRGGPISRRQ
jgi:transposase-like protein